MPLQRGAIPFPVRVQLVHGDLAGINLQSLTGVDALPAGPFRPSVNEVLGHANSTEALMLHLFNDLEAAALSTNPALADVAERLNQMAPGLVGMTGSGSAFFRLFDAQRGADAFARQVRDALRVRVELVPLVT